MGIDYHSIPLILLTTLFTFSFTVNDNHENTYSVRQMVITIDDLPVNTQIDDLDYQKVITENILDALDKFDVPAIGFVNEYKLYENDVLVKDRLRILEKWINRGQELGNHSYSHSDYHRTEFHDFTADIIKGEILTKKLLREHDKNIRYFRHPYLHTGNTEAKKMNLSRFLAENSYETAPVTIDNSEWIYARAYEMAFTDADSNMMKKVGENFIEYMEQKVAYYERQSRDLFDYEIPQILLLHANKLNADYIEGILTMLENRNYSFIPLKKALEDSAYQSKNTYTGPGGISWIHRWAISKGVDRKFFAGEPKVPEFVLDYAGIRQE